MSDSWKLSCGNYSAHINTKNQQLTSLQYKGNEIMHSNVPSEYIMFPIVGKADNYEIIDEGKQYPADQHGFGRLLPFVCMHHDTTTLVLRATYKANEELSNPKAHADPSRPNMLSFGKNVVITKTFELKENGLHVQFTIHNTDTHSVHYDFGWHPWFILSAEAQFTNKEKTYSIEAIREIADQTLRLPRVQSIMYHRGDVDITVSSDMPHMQLWTPSNANHVCIEPVTGFDSAPRRQSILAPGKTNTYTTTIRCS